MLFFPSGYPKPVRIQGAFISDKEVSSVVEFLKKNNNEAVYSDDIHDKINNAKLSDGAGASGGDERDEYFAEAGKFIIEKDKASIGMLQRVYKIGFNRAARIMDQLAEAGVVARRKGQSPEKSL
jgi:S-DNA-T family DNA segregation ATPase FtsK/SpoIIIE